MTDERQADERQARPNPSQGGDGPNALSALESAESYLTASATAGGAGDGSGPSFSASFATLLHWGEANKLIRAETDFPFFRRIPDGHGDEHEGWFDETCGRWYKATYPNQFGVAWGRNGSATACEYLTRLVLQNRHFADDIQLVALVNCGKKLRVITSQPHVVGEHALYEEIKLWFSGLGFSRFESNGSVAWYRENDNLLVSDAHEGNVIRSITGALFAIDLNLMNPNDEIRALVISMLMKF